ncbi:hypothetical protein BKE38_24690 [Pseudoroseomonas deserti]|uniref:Uncharacterized protein n=1 Tax=Teichococcus deserti TaxID=1817963 RepID=A0A1V2GVL9_9PROT|nr:hypothetical protein [Pseudoroseomonas deserti]ONG46949.1 hypothetical protein BKE38_24690 [Pseudoroseomonas deserti]
MTLLHDGPIFADYFHFLLQDAALRERPAVPWDDASLADGVVAMPGLLAFATARNMQVPVYVESLASEPALALDGVDHAVEASVESSGMLILAGGTDYLPTAARLPVAPGMLRVRLLCRGLDTLSEDGLAGEDSYRLLLWPASFAEVAVLKRHA